MKPVQDADKWYPPEPRKWHTPWQYCKICDQEDRDKRRAAKTDGPLRVFDGNQPYDSWIVYWSRRGLRRVDALAPWSQFVHICNKRLSRSPWMRGLRGRYYAEDRYVLLTTVCVMLWAFLTIGLTKPSSWQATDLAWVLLIPGALLIPLYVRASSHRIAVFIPWILVLASAVMFPAFFGLGGWVRWAVPWPLILRGFEILFTVARIVVFDTLTGGYKHTPVSRVRYLCYVILYFIQICFIFAVIYSFWTPYGFLDPLDCLPAVGGHCAMISGLNENIYLSVATATTLGSGFQPIGGLAQWLQMLEVASGILLLAVGLATFVGSVRLSSLKENQPPYGVWRR